MKVVEKLFNSYLQVSPDEYVQKYLSAMSVLAITEEEGSKEIAKIHKIRDCLSKEFPISIFKATKFLSSKETRVTYRSSGGISFSLDKSKGHDYKIRDVLGVAIENINRIVVVSMKRYNTDRGRDASSEDDDLEDFS